MLFTFQRTREEGTNPLPCSVIVVLAAPPGRVVGVTELSTGIGLIGSLALSLPQAEAAIRARAEGNRSRAIMVLR